MEASPPPPEPPPEGWYPDPDGRGQRYWDGERWTEHLAPAEQPQAPGSEVPAQRPQMVGGRVKDPRNNGLATAGYVFAILLPIVGLIIAIVLYSRNDSRGTPVLLTCVVGFFIGLMLLGV